MKRPTASALDRAFACPGSFALPQANTSSVYAEAGTSNHEEQEQAIESGIVPDEIRRHLGAAADTARAEVRLAYDYATDRGRILGYGSNRDYSECGPTEFAGTADVVAYDDERVYIVDRKLWQSATEAERNSQLRHLALAACRAIGRHEARVILIYEARRPDVADLDAVDLATHRARLRALDAAIAEQDRRVASGSMPDVAEGAYCKHCPAAHACPAKIALVRRLVSGEEADELSLLMPLDDEAAAFAYERLGQARALLKRIENALYARAAESPIPLGNGRWFGKHTKLGNERIDGDIAYTTIREKYGQEIADKAVERTATKKAIREALKAAGAKPVAKAEESLLGAIRKAGGATRESKEDVGEYTAAPQLVGNENKDTEAA